MGREILLRHDTTIATLPYPVSQFGEPLTSLATSPLSRLDSLMEPPAARRPSRSERRHGAKPALALTPGYNQRMRIGWSKGCALGVALLLWASTAAGAHRPRPVGWGTRVAEAAREFLAEKPGTRRPDCSGLVEAVMARAGVTVSGNSRTLWQDAVREKRLTSRPLPGDLVFFDRTYDANKNGRVDDELTHVAIVVAVDKDGTILSVHRGSGRIAPLHLNVRHAALRSSGKRTLNDYLRAPGYGSPKGPRLAGQLVRGFAHPPPPPG